MRPLVLVLLLALPLLGVACGGSDDDDATASAVTTQPGSSPANGETPLPTGMLDDEEYLAVVCTGLAEFSDALNTAETEESLSDVVRDYVASLQAVTPPEDVQSFHQELIAYLSAAVDNPTELVTSPRPLPEEDVRDRLAEKEASVDACRDASFFSEREEDES